MYLTSIIQCFDFDKYLTLPTLAVKLVATLIVEMVKKSIQTHGQPSKNQQANK